MSQRHRLLTNAVGAVLLLAVAACSGRDHDGADAGDSSPRTVPLRSSPISFEVLPGDDPALAEAKTLARAYRFEAALDLIRRYRQSHRDDPTARKLELALENRIQEQRMLGLIKGESEEHDPVLGDPDYQRARELADRPVRERLKVVEWLVENKRHPEAISTCNGILDERPYDEATLHIRNNILEHMVDFEKRRIARAAAIRRGEVVNEMAEGSMMPRQPDPIPREVIVFDEDLEAQEREKVLAKLDLRIPSINYKQAPIGTVLKEIFAIAGINYVLEDEALGAKTLTIRLLDVNLRRLLKIVQRLDRVRFNYRGNTVYVTSADSEILIPEIIRLKSGRIDTQKQPKLGQVSGGPSSGGGGGGMDLFGGGDDEMSDLERLLEQLPDLIPDWPADSVVYYEPKSNSVYLKSSPSAIAEAKRLIHAMDYESAMVLIEAKFVEVSHEAERELGIDWKLGAFKTSGSRGVIAGGGQSGGTASGSLFADLASLANPDLANAASSSLESAVSTIRGAKSAASSLGGSGGLTAGLLGAGLSMSPNFEVQLNALENKGMANTLSEPKILTISNALGMIDISRDLVYIEEVEIEDFVINNYDNYAGGNTGDVNIPENRVIKPRIGTDYDGINFMVKPSVARNGEIIAMHLVPTVRFAVDLKEFPITTAAGSEVGTINRYEFQTRRLATTLYVKDGQTVVLGGLISARENQRRSGIPGLMDVPLLGQAFRTDKKTMERRKLLIFLTAHLVDPTGAHFTQDVRHLRDIARVILPANVQQQIDEAEAARALETERERLDYREKAREAFPHPTKRPGRTTPATG